MIAIVMTLAMFSFASADDAVTYKVGICNYVDHASLNQIVDNVRAQLKTLGEENNIEFIVDYQNCNADSSVLNQIISNFIADGVDLMVGIATPVAMAMQTATEDNAIPVVFAAVSDPTANDLVASLEEPGANITGTSDYLDTNTVMNLVFAADPDAQLIGLLYDVGQDSSTAAIASAKEYLEARNVAYKDYPGTNVSDVILAVDALIADQVDAVFTPTDNTIMSAELSIYEALAEAGIPHYAGADSFALNGAFLGYGLDYAILGVDTANMVYDILVNGADPAVTPVKTYENGSATINTETAAALGLDFDALRELFAPYCADIYPIVTNESFAN